MLSSFHITHNTLHIKHSMIPLKDNIPRRIFPVCTILLILINIGVFFYEVSLGRLMSDFIKRFGCIPYEITHFKDIEPFVSYPVYFTIGTSIFLHGGWLHLIGNMLFLYIFGDNIEEWLGRRRFILFYIGCGIAASIAQIILTPNSKLPTVGASGAIAGIMGAFLILYPRARVLTVIPIFIFIRMVWVPAFMFLGFWIILQIFNSMFAHGTNIAFFAHIAGFFAGLFSVRAIKRRKMMGFKT